MADPEIIFLDEPTSGLSSVDAKIVMDILKGLSGSGKSVILTIHQPSLSNYKKIDLLLVLSRGEMAYFGKNYPDSIEFFNRDSRDPSLIDEPDNTLLGLDRGEKRGIVWSRLYRDSPIYKRYVEDRGEGREDYRGIDRVNSIDSRVNPLKEFKILGERYLRVKLKDRLNGIFLILQSPIVALLLILIYGGSGYSQYRENPTTLLSVLIIASIWFGVINSVREMYRESHI